MIVESRRSSDSTTKLRFFQVFCGSISSLRCEYSWRYRAEVRKPVRRLAVRASGPDAVALMQASCARTQTLRLRHGASDWETASGGLGSSWKGGPGFVRATADATKRVPPDLRLSTFDFPGFPMPQSGLPNLPGSGHGRAAGLAAHEACFGATADTPQNAQAHSRQFSKFGAVAP